MNDLIAHPLFMKGVTAALLTLIILLLTRFAQDSASQRIDDKDIRYKTRKAISFAGYMLAAMSVLILFNDQMKNLAVILGALSVGIGFALREVIQSLLGWLAISFWSLYKPGERIQMGNVMGDVIDINPLITTVMECGGWVRSDLYNGRLVRLSNSLVFKENILNYTADFPFLWDEIVIPVRTSSDHKLARSIIEKAGKAMLTRIADDSREAWHRFAQQYRVEDAQLDSMVTMSFDSNYIEFTLRYVVDYRVRRSTKSLLFARILEDFQATGGKVQIGSSTLELSDARSRPGPSAETEAAAPSRPD
ncbi:MAG: mechanosensitive ion channel [Gallionella sp.]|nr:mechanosensitive ion channel [Gallionella sp.]MDD4945474.1 mechanosensitive ion channel [Gallionella sp.]MDD5612215.1 mechanosensitive ion channel [Gallionella sp.]